MNLFLVTFRCVSIKLNREREIEFQTQGHILYFLICIMLHHLQGKTVRKRTR